MAKNQYRKEPLKDNVEEMFIGPFGSSLKNECFVDERNAYCMVYEQKHAIQKTLAGKNRFVDRNKYQELKRFTVKPGDIIVSCRGTIGETFIIPENAPLGIMHPSIMKIRLKPNVYNIEYFNLLLKSRLEAYNKSANGSGVKMAISATELGKDLFPIPPMDEQQKISRIFFMVEHLILLRKQQLAKMDELVKARFVEMFGDEQAFNKEPLSQNVEEMFIGPFGSSLKNENFVSKENGYCMVYEQKHAIRKTMDVETRYIDKPKYEELKRFSIHGGDIIVSCRGTIGETYIVPLNAPLGIMHPSIMKIRVKDSIYNRVFFDFLLQEKLKQHEAQANGSGVKMAVTASALGKEEFIVPSIPFQNQFAAFVERVDQQKQTVQQSLEKLELMKKALMQEYFG